MEGQRETRLYDAALGGDVPSLLELLRDDPLILDRCIIEKSCRFVQSPLHVATNHGHLEFIKEILCHKPELAEELDQSKRWSPLHMASAKGHLEILKALLAVNSSMCFVRDKDGRNVIHVAAMNGQIQVLGVLLRAKPQAARERTTDGETVLQLCVKHSQSQALMFLVRTMGDAQLLNSKDSDGNTILHLSVAAKHYESIEFLLKDKRMEKNAINTNGLTAMDTCIQTKKDGHDGGIWLALRHAKVSKAKVLRKPKKSSRDWLDKQRTALMVVSSLIATMAFQAGINPPGGVWQDDKDGHKAGTSIMAHVKKQSQHDLGIYNVFLISNTVGLVSSLTVIILLISGLPCMRLVMGFLMVTMWIAVTATTMTYIVSVYFLVFFNENLISSTMDLTSSSTNPVLSTITFVIGVWVIVLGLLVFGHVLRLCFRLIKQIIRLVIQGIKSTYTKARNYPPV
ncbi:ankyrin repeat-containing protein ITN1-like [Beta vulgaris subsp. vulgaris]|uniref:ankyrin repeat-containing protein ITN1-like n=1 Tax=Beta vulgaris subsp. vulgaris TaxID=3555 RepID=UPI0020368327|nr:ankyrin repeat-containing protein ITN1-like [Beta vulgaris subsp. vulgaris]